VAIDILRFVAWNFAKPMLSIERKNFVFYTCEETLNFLILIFTGELSLDIAKLNIFTYNK